MRKTLLVGDNPFQGVSHFSQERARDRDINIQDPVWAAEIIKTSYENGADGFMFSVTENTLNILKMLPKNVEKRRYYAIVPAAGDYVRLSSQVGTSGLLKYVAKATMRSGNFAAITYGISGAVRRDLDSLLKAYLAYEILRIRLSLGRGNSLYSLMLHELVTEMAVAMNMDWLIQTYINYLISKGVKPGFETRNFTLLANKLKELKIDVNNIVITAPFNKLGFQMNPSQIECEKSLKIVPGAEIIAMSTLASGRLKPYEANKYLNSMPELNGYVIGVSKKQQAKETFTYFKNEN